MQISFYFFQQQSLPNKVVKGVWLASNCSDAQASSKRDVKLPICNSTTCVSRRYITKHKNPVLLYIWKRNKSKMSSHAHIQKEKNVIKLKLKM